MNYYETQIKKLSNQYQIDGSRLEEEFKPFYTRVFERDYNFKESKAYNNAVIGIHTIEVLKRYLRRKQ